jgi:NAD dependent epimerase/dehydratase family enzyme
LLLASQRVEPAKLRESGYEYRYPELEGAFRHLLGR